MTEDEALKYAQKLWGAGQFNAKIKRVGKRVKNATEKNLND